MGWTVLVLILALPERPSVGLTVAPCLSSVSAELRRVLAVELGGPVGKQSAGSDVAVRVNCDERRINFEVEARERVPIASSLERGDLPPLALARALALMLAESVVEAWASPPVVRPPEPVPTPPAPVAPAVALPVTPEPPPTLPLPPLSTRSADSRLDVDVSGVVRGGGPLRAGPMAQATVWLHWLGARVDLAYLRGGPPRSVTVIVDTGEAALAVTGRLRLSWLSLEAAAGARLGFVALRSRETERTVSGFLLGPTTSLTALAHPWAGLRVGVSLEGGLWNAEVRGRLFDEDDVVVGGWWWGVRLHLGWGFGR
ncbi:MAG: hypothetical protein MUC96_05645 [Myxococcaceae bacterium]|nr:hypothetical protein [Myxococcaceae bacterium]